MIPIQVKASMYYQIFLCQKKKRLDFEYDDLWQHRY